MFVDTKEEAAAFDPAAFFDCPAHMLGRTFNRPRTAQLADEKLVLGGGERALKGVRKAERWAGQAGLVGGGVMARDLGYRHRAHL